MAGGAFVCVSEGSGGRPVQRPVHRPAGAARQRERLTACEVFRAERGRERRRGSQGLRWLGPLDDPHVRGRVRGAADQRNPVPVGAQAPRSRRRVARAVRVAPAPRPGGTRRGRRGPPTSRRATRRAVGQLRHGRLPEDPVGPVELGPAASVSGSAPGRDAGRAGVHVGLPPPSPVRDEAQRAVASPGWLPDRLLRSAGRRPRACPPAPACRRRGRRNRRDRAGRTSDGRGVPRHVRVVPDHDGQARRRRVHARARRRSRAHRAESISSGWLPAAVESATMLRCGGRPVPPGGPRGRPAPNARPPWRSARRGGGPTPSGGAAVSGRGGRSAARLAAVAEPHRWSDWST